MSKEVPDFASIETAAHEIASRLLNQASSANQSDGSTPAARTRYADFLVEIGFLSLADQLYASVVNAHPAHRGALSGRLSVATRSDDTSAALARAYDFAAAFPKDETVLRKLAWAAIKHDAPDVAKEVYERLSEHQPRDIDLLHAIAKAFRRHEEDTNAIDVLETALTKAPETKAVRIDLIALLQKVDQPEAAIEQCDLGLNAFPKDPTFSVARAKIMMVNGESKAAAEFLGSVLDAKTSDLMHCAVWTNALSKSGELESARNVAVELITRKRDFKTAWLKLFELSEREGDVDQALQTLGMAEEVFPGEDWLLRRKASLLRRAGNFASSIEIYEKLLSDSPGDTVTFRAYVRTLAESGHPDRAEAALADFAMQGGDSLSIVSERVQQAVDKGDLIGAATLIENRLLKEV